MLDRVVVVSNVFIATDGKEKSRVDFRIEGKITSSFSLLMTASEARYYAGLMAQNKTLKLTVDMAPSISESTAEKKSEPIYYPPDTVVASK